MSSATPRNPYASSQIIASNVGTRVAQGGRDSQDDQAADVNFGMSDRQMMLNMFWTYYRCSQYDSRVVNWDGEKHGTHLEHEMIATDGYIPPGFVDKGGKSLPLRFRRPSVPFHMTKIIVDRFTALLFSAKRHPKIEVLGDKATQEVLEGVMEIGKFWPACIQMRTHGGAMGSGCMSFQIYHGLPIFEVHDPRWCFPTFKDKITRQLIKLEIKYLFFEEVKTEDGWEKKWFWYRRLINETMDIVWEKVPAGKDDPPWDHLEGTAVTHNLGFCPAVWVQNTRTDDDIDGDPDCYGSYDMQEVHDGLNSQSAKGALANCDPTLLIKTDADLPGELRKGSDNSLQLPQGSDASYLEIGGGGITAARTLAKDFKDMVFEMAACVPDTEQSEGPDKTATEITSRTARMLERADMFREQYGEYGIKPILRIAMRVLIQALSPQQVEEEKEDGTPVRRIVQGVIELPPIVEEQESGEVTIRERQMGKGGFLKITWPDYAEPSLDDKSKAATAVSTARGANAMDMDTAVKTLAQYFPIDSVKSSLARLKEETKENAIPDLTEMFQ